MQFDDVNLLSVKLSEAEVSGLSFGFRRRHVNISFQALSACTCEMHFWACNPPELLTALWGLSCGAAHLQIVI